MLKGCNKRLKACNKKLDGCSNRLKGCNKRLKGCNKILRGFNKSPYPKHFEFPPRCNFSNFCGPLTSLAKVPRFFQPLPWSMPTNNVFSKPQLEKCFFAGTEEFYVARVSLNASCLPQAEILHAYHFRESILRQSLDLDIF